MRLTRRQFEQGLIGAAVAAALKPAWARHARGGVPVSTPTGVNFPLTAAVGISGDVNNNQELPPVPYSGQISGKVMSSSGYFQESVYSDPIPWLGRYDISIIGGNWEQWDEGSTYDRGLLVDTAQQITNVSGYSPCDVWQYHLYESSLLTAAAPYNSAYPTITSEKWLLYGAANQTGSPTNDSSGGGFYSTNWSVAWPGVVNGVAADQLISPGRTTATYNDGPEDFLQYAAAYYIELTVARHTSFTGVVCGTIPASGYTDSRWYPTLESGSNNDAMKAPNIGSIYTDNLFCFPQTAGYYDLANNYATYSYTSPVIPWFLRGAQHFKARQSAILAECYPTRTYLRTGNISHFTYVYWANQSTFTTLADGLAGYLDGGLIEGTVGASWSFDTAYGTAPTIASCQAIMDFCSGPKKAIVQGYPASATDYQTMRYTIGIALMARSYCCVGLESYRISDQYWPDEFGGNPGTNIYKGWLGSPVGLPPTAAAVNGVWIAYFTNGVYLLNPRGNGTQTVTAAQINTYLGTSHTFAYFQGVQDTAINSGAAMTSATIAAADGLALRIASSGPSVALVGSWDSGSSGATAVNSVTLSRPLGAQVGDLLVVWATNSIDNGVSSVSDSEIGSLTSSAASAWDATDTNWSQLYWKVATAADSGGTITVDFTGSSKYSECVAALFRATDASFGGAVGANGQIVNATAGGTVSTPSVAPSAYSALALAYSQDITGSAGNQTIQNGWSAGPTGNISGSKPYMVSAFTIINSGAAQGSWTTQSTDGTANYNALLLAIQLT